MPSAGAPPGAGPEGRQGRLGVGPRDGTGGREVAEGEGVLDAVVEGLYLAALQEPEDAFLQLTAALAGDNLHQRDPLLNRLADDAVQFIFDASAFVVDIVEVEFQLGH